MEKNNKNPNEIKIEVRPEVAGGIYSNLALVSHSPNDFFVDFIIVTTNSPVAQVESRIILTPENAKNLVHALAENVARYEATFGEIKQRVPRQPKPQGGIPNPFSGPANA